MRTFFLFTMRAYYHDAVRARLLSYRTTVAGTTFRGIVCLTRTQLSEIPLNAVSRTKTASRSSRPSGSTPLDTNSR